MHAIAETVQRARQAPGTYGFVGANGRVMSKYSVGVYSTRPAGWGERVYVRLSDAGNRVTVSSRQHRG